jgi:chemotaxis protein histidine kinase CheA
MTNITFDFLKRQKALEQAEAEAKREADRLKEEEAKKQEEAKKEAQRLEEERQKQELAAREAQKAREQQELEAKRKAEAELAAQKAKEAAETPKPPPPTPLAAALDDNHSSRTVNYTPSGCTLGEFRISNEKTEGMGNDGNLLVILAIRCVNFPDTPIPTSNWQIDGKDVGVQAGRIRASLSPGQHEVTALPTSKAGSQPTEVKAVVTVQKTGDCVVIPRK